MDDVTYAGSGRSIDIELGGQEEGQCKVSVWTKLAGEYWRRGILAAAERIAHSAIEWQMGATASSPPIYALLANIQIAHAQKAPKVVLSEAQYYRGVLAEKPTNVVALLGKHSKLFQQILQLNPQCIPDPRIGIGLCLWAMDHKSKAKAAMAAKLRSKWSAQLLLGLESINASKTENLSEKDRAQAFLAGTKFIEKAFNANQKSAAAANALCELFLRKGSYKRALKLAERTIQFADTLTLLTEGNLRAARVWPAKTYLGAIGMAQMQIQNDETAAAIHTLDLLLQPPNPQRSVEAMVMLASLRAHPRPGVSSSDFAQEKAKARELFDRAIKALEQDDSRASNVSYINDDLDMHVEIARLWQEESLDRTTRALKEALRLSEANERIDPRLLNNMGALQHLEGNVAEARAFYEDALTKAASLGQDVAESMSITMLYNLARVYEDSGDVAMAKEAYDKLLARHPEYVDAKVRQAQMLADLNQSNEAHELLKQAMASQNSNLNLRAFYTYFLIQSNFPKPAKDFVFATLKDHDKHDVYSLCAAGWIQYHQSRESRDSTPKGLEERRRALLLDPLCAVAAQGLAIVTAEDATRKRMRNARDALDIFAKIRESLADGSVYLNMGHCYYARDEFDRAIESYETASVRFYSGHNVSVLLCLCRTWYAKASKDQSFVAMSTALKYAQKALHLQPSDKAILYNIAMVQQKAAELLFGLSPSKRTLKDLEWAILQAGHAQRLFASLAADSASVVPYSRDIADQRRKYGESMLRRGDEHLATQKEFEAEAQAKLDAARQRRQLEREKQEALEVSAFVLFRSTRKNRRTPFQMESDEERERKSKRAAKKVKVEGESGDEGAEPKKKKRGGGKLKKTIDQDVDNEQLFSDEEVDSKPAKKRVPKKRVVRDDDDQEAVGGPRKKQYKSKEIISDTDDEDMS
ncbi:uncharacterized protein EDB91DRAFT_1169030 [Suillus paluster]|uniref:uncharacterized protein n=1 Tax=Suillus paluster TaxID=48578 RepID=UPI001B87AD83|nr:uncharacterized protein EDB91DRAFT_1169030 [Suillus paluster]KAG1725277.1 hypothetical protein EDB91DRAFT_1169030 [Suillus paluster]